MLFNCKIVIIMWGNVLCFCCVCLWIIIEKLDLIFYTYLISINLCMQSVDDERQRDLEHKSLFLFSYFHENTSCSRCVMFNEKRNAYTAMNQLIKVGIAAWYKKNYHARKAYLRLNKSQLRYIIKILLNRTCHMHTYMLHCLVIFLYQ